MIAFDHYATRDVTMNKKVGWIGLGRMGEAMVMKLIKAGHLVHVWNRTASKAIHLVDHGATIVTDRIRLADAEVVFTMVSTTEDLKEVLFGRGGLVTGSSKPRVLVDSSSISQEGSAEIRQKLEAIGVAYLCAPVSGNAKVAKAGKLLVVASGPRALYDMAEPYLQAMSRKTMWVGEGELARIWKIAHNTMFGVIIQNLCEITILAEKAGIPRHIFLESINESVLGSMYTRYKTPVLCNLNWDHVTFTPALLLKDMDLGMGAARELGVPMPVAAATRESISRMVSHGHGEVDFAILLEETAKDAGFEIKSLNLPIPDGLTS
jgi:3-hydroxyisobutyrate dehydrogenase